MPPCSFSITQKTAGPGNKHFAIFLKLLALVARECSTDKQSARCAIAVEYRGQNESAKYYRAVKLRRQRSVRVKEKDLVGNCCNSKWLNASITKFLFLCGFREIMKTRNPAKATYLTCSAPRSRIHGCRELSNDFTGLSARPKKINSWNRSLNYVQRRSCHSSTNCILRGEFLEELRLCVRVVVQFAAVVLMHQEQDDIPRVLPYRDYGVTNVRNFLGTRDIFSGRT